jgi:hypothetical protein
MNWNQHVIGIGLIFLVATLLVVSGGTWMVLLLVGGQSLVHQFLGDNFVRAFLVVTFVFLGVTQLVVLVFLWGVLIVVGGKWLIFHVRHFREAEA